MQKKVEEHIFQGMQRDMSISKQKAEFLWDAHNIRLTSRHGDTLMSMTNERGTKQYSNTINGVVLGYCVLGDYLTVFTTDISAQSKPDYIYRFRKENDGFESRILYNGNLGFDVNHPIECLGVYENVDIQKVYWTDGINQPRFINITKHFIDGYIDTSFDFIPTLALKDSIHVKKVADSSGLFPAGVIQYAVTYYNKYGQESNVSVVSPLIPTSYTQRAGSPEETIGNAFKVTIDNPDTQFEFLRLYSIFRSSKDTTPVCKRVADVRLGYGGKTSRILHTSDDKGTTKYARVDWDNGVYFKEDIDSGFALLSDNQSHLGTTAVNVDGVTFNANEYYHFTKEDNPYLIIKAYTYGCGVNGLSDKVVYFTWDNCTDLYISTVDVNGPGQGGYSLIYVDGQEEMPRMIAASDLHYRYTEFVSNGSITITDNNTIGEDIDYNELLFVGGEEITAGTITQKDGTMFLGDIKISRPQITGDYKIIDVDTLNNSYITTELSKDSEDVNLVTVIRKGTSIDPDYRTCCFPVTMNSSSYKWGNTLDAHIFDTTLDEDNDNATNPDTGESTNIGGFKARDHYRLGLQFQYKTGKWSQPVFISDETETNNPSLDIRSDMCVQNVPTFTATLNATVGNYLLSNNYLRVRPVVCFPTESDQLVLCQGLLNPTVHSVAGRINHTPDVQSSWYFRPVPAGTEWDSIIDDETEEITYIENRFDGGIPQFKHGYTLYSGNIYQEWNDTLQQDVTVPRPLRHDEIQGVPPELSNVQISTKVDADYELLNPINVTSYAVYNITLNLNDSRDMSNIFVTDWSYLTFHSPEFEFNDSFHNIEESTYKCKIVGKHLVSTNEGDIHIITKSTTISSDGSGFFHRCVFTGRCAYRINAGLFYRDAIVGLTYDKTGYEANNSVTTGDNNPDTHIDIRSFLVYPWHRTGSLNNDCVRPETAPGRTGVLEQKKLINMMYFGTISNDNTILLNDAQIKIFNSDQIALTKINGTNYFGNIDQVLSSNIRYPIGYAETLDFLQHNLGYISRDTWNAFEKKANGLMLPNDPVYMKYKSTPHAIIHTTSFEDGIEGNAWEQYEEPVDGCLFDGKLWPWLYCAEMYRGELPTDFGGTSAMAIHNNLWYPAGPAIEIRQNTDTEIQYMYGDTYYQRYDCLKTYPFTDEDTNSIIEIGSFMVETRINMDGRYDKNRANTQNFMLNPTNFNIINSVYSQMDNFFNYRILDEDYYALSKYPTMVTWTGYKNNAAEIDNWTNITLASTLEMDGTNGKVNAVRVNSDQLYCFQDDAVGQILFNSRVQISPSDGVPIEISNNYKVDGNRYISTTIGCKNKWSIIEGIDGLYFIDDSTKALYLLGGQSQIKAISTPLNMSYWFTNQDTATPWVQHYWSGDGEMLQQGIRCFYDAGNADLYICTPEETLCYSEKLGQFVSFFDYHNVIGMFNIDSDYYALNYSDANITAGIKLWKMFKGTYNNLFDKIYPTDFTFISNEAPGTDKIFTNIELRGDFRFWAENEVEDDFNSINHVVDHRRMFDTLRVWNEYQDTGDVDLRFIDDTVSNMKKKFRIWRMDIPRDKDNMRQRIRNTWSKVKFTMNTLSEFTLEDIFNGASNEYTAWNSITQEWENLSFKNRYDTVQGEHHPEYVLRSFKYDSVNDKIIESWKYKSGSETVNVNTQCYILKDGIIHRYSYEGDPSRSIPYAYRKIYDMEIHDVGVVYFA